MKWILVIIGCCLSSAIFADTTMNDGDTVKQTITKIMKENHIPGVAVELFIAGKPSSYNFGYADAVKKKPVTQQTIFEIGSISKIMTSILLAQQIDAAKIQIDDSITTVLPHLPTAFDDISFKNLATHTSGLPFSAPETIKTRTALENYFKTWEPKEDADETWTYSNFGIGLLGYSLETLLHQNYNQLYRKNILMPLHMQAIGITVPQNLLENYAQGYDKSGAAVKPLQAGLFPAAGAVKASAQDMQQFLRAAIGLPGTPDKIFYPMRMTQASYVKLADQFQGLGWQIHSLDESEISNLLSQKNDELRSYPVEEMIEKPTFDGNALIDKTGTTNGFRAYIAVIPNKKTGIVLLMNKNVDNNVLVHSARQILFKVNNLLPNLNNSSAKNSDDETE
jgi:beta-lactamase class C